MTDMVSEMKTLQSVIQNQITCLKNMEQSMERLRSVEQLLERVASSNEEIVRHMQIVTAAYRQASASSKRI